MMSNKRKPIGVELIPGRISSIYGGPYLEKPDYMYGVKMAREIGALCDVDIPTEDYNVPDARVFRDGLHKAIMHLIESREPIYVGCMGGVGRTGLFLAVVMKVDKELSGVPYSTDTIIQELRRKYHPEAVETDKQAGFIEAIYVEDIVASIRQKVNPVKVHRSWGAVIRKWLVDHDILTN